ncbi:helix-turn-helix domain-containing protein [Maridesulfovibrio hydrothermalis]|uniref:Transcriptional regulator, XRE family n=1 Tax=Maridesulfovibrio hydrothermalis AM13 = DSM 14728 TaxID=1121451 RepID=L0RCM5_9BACT|nr:RodZ domain-containing protein [Maridesulfovibrio hydrothermalis]CCO24538.1 Transcriptional regulator, XRE family [Maridesulfovibrio hydrothermalis AM13 = DSM 14728]
MDLKELGSQLRTERQRQGLTIEQIMEITKVSRINIIAIESGNQKEFPHQVYAKGFIKTYAKALGLNADEIGEEFSKIIESSEDNDLFHDEESQQSQYSTSTKGAPVGAIFAIILLLGFVGGLVYYLHDNSLFGMGQEQQTEILVTEEAVEEAPVPDELNTAVQESSPEKTSTGNISEKTIAQETELAAPDVVEEKQIAPVETSQPEIPVPAILPKNTVVITVKPGEACWLEAIVDGESKEYVIQEGDALSLGYKDSLKVKLGNAGGVVIVSDGKPFTFSAPKGKVKTLKFPVSR